MVDVVLKVSTLSHTKTGSSFEDLIFQSFTTTTTSTNTNNNSNSNNNNNNPRISKQEKRDMIWFNPQKRMLFKKFSCNVMYNKINRFPDMLCLLKKQLFPYKKVRYCYFVSTRVLRA